MEHKKWLKQLREVHLQILGFSVGRTRIMITYFHYRALIAFYFSKHSYRCVCVCICKCICMKFKRYVVKMGGAHFIDLGCEKREGRVKSSFILSVVLPELPPGSLLIAKRLS